MKPTLTETKTKMKAYYGDNWEKIERHMTEKYQNKAKKKQSKRIENTSVIDIINRRLGRKIVQRFFKPKGVK